MRRARLFVTGIGALILAGCPSATAPHQVGVSGGGGGALVLRFTVQPTTANSGAFITPAVQVAITDSAGVIDTTATGGVTITFSNNPGGATLGGTTVVPFTSGVSVFPDLTVSLPGTGYSLLATSGALTVTSNSFNIN